MKDNKNSRRSRTPSGEPPSSIYVGTGTIIILVEHWQRLDEKTHPVKQVTALIYRDPENHKGESCIIKPEVLSPEEEAYFLPYVFNTREQEARTDYIDFHGARMDLGNERSLSPVKRAIADALRAADALEDTKGAPEHKWLKGLGLSLRIWASVVRSCYNFYFGQQIRDRNHDAIYGEPRIPPKKGMWDGDPDLIPWNNLMRDELDNAGELIAVLERGAKTDRPTGVD